MWGRKEREGCGEEGRGEEGALVHEYLCVRVHICGCVPRFVVVLAG